MHDSLARLHHREENHIFHNNSRVFETSFFFDLPFHFSHSNFSLPLFTFSRSFFFGCQFCVFLRSCSFFSHKKRQCDRIAKLKTESRHFVQKVNIIQRNIHRQRQKKIVQLNNRLYNSRSNRKSIIFEVKSLKSIDFWHF